MARYVEVTPEQVQAARLAVRAYEAAGQQPDPYLVRLADARLGDPRETGRDTGPPPQNAAPPTVRDGWWPRVGAGVAVGAVAVLVGSLVGFALEPIPRRGALDLLLLGTVWLLGSLPGWLYLRFTRQRVAALWDEFVLTLHRLGWDEPGFLPRPPTGSAYYEGWLFGGGPLYEQDRNLYRQKFEARYGASVLDQERGTGTSVHVDAVLPVLLATAVLAGGWAAVLADAASLAEPSSLVDILGFGFLGAYLRIASGLLRSYALNDLRPGAYLAAVRRVVVVLLLLTAAHQVLGGLPGQVEAFIAFVVGGFPAALRRGVGRLAQRLMAAVVPQLVPEHPLADLEGLDPFYEARLQEEGIDDQQALLTADLVDVFLHTRIPVGRLLDWVDQAALYVRLDGTAGRASAQTRRSSQAEPAAGIPTRAALRRLGIRTATDLLRAFPSATPGRPGRPGATGPVEAPANALPLGLDDDRIRTLVHVLDQDPALAVVGNWQRGSPGAAGEERPESGAPWVPPAVRRRQGPVDLPRGASPPSVPS